MWKLLLVFLMLASYAWADSSQNASTEYSGSQAIKSSPGVVKSVTFTYNGVVAGTTIKLYDSLSASGTVRLTLTAATTAGSQTVTYPVDAYYATGIYYQEGNHTGTVVTDVQSF